MFIRWFDNCTEGYRKHYYRYAIMTAEDAVKIVREKQPEACAVASFREWMDKWRYSRTIERGGGGGDVLRY